MNQIVLSLKSETADLVASVLMAESHRLSNSAESFEDADTKADVRRQANELMATATQILGMVTY